MPVKKQITETMPEQTTTLLKLKQQRIEVRAGKTTKLEISIVPIILMPTTIVTAVRMAIKVL